MKELQVKATPEVWNYICEVAVIFPHLNADKVRASVLAELNIKIQQKMVVKGGETDFKIKLKYYQALSLRDGIGLYLNYWPTQPHERSSLSSFNMELDSKLN